MARIFVTGSADGLGLMAGEHPKARDVAFQDAFMAYCAKVSGIPYAGAP
jgi:hypothetical protein